MGRGYRAFSLLEWASVRNRSDDVTDATLEAVTKAKHIAKNVKSHLSSTVYMGGHNQMLIDANEAMQTLIAAINAMPGWQPIKTAPKDGTHVLIWCPGHWEDDRKVFEAWCYNDTGKDEWVCYDINGASGIVTPAFWQPLPPPPGETQ